MVDGDASGKQLPDPDSMATTKSIPPKAKTPRRKTASPAKKTIHRYPPRNRSSIKSKTRADHGPKSAPILESDLFRTMMEHTTDRIYFKDAESRFLFINRSTAAWMGLDDPGKIIGKTDFDFFTEEHARQAYTDEQQIIAGGQAVVGIEEKETWPDGHETWVSTTKLPLRNRAGRIIGTFGISRDITEHRRGEEARIAAAVLRESNAALETTNAALQVEITERQRVERELAYERDLFRTMMDNTSDHIYFKDAQSRFLLINKAQSTKFGLSDPAWAVGKTDFDFFSDEHARRAFTDERKILAGDLPFVGVEEKETWPDGNETWVSTTKFPMRDSDGGIIGTFGVSRDITERKAIESSILLTNRELEKANAVLQKEISERRQTEQALAYERDLFRTMMDNTSDHIYFKDLESRFILMNRAQASVFGLSDPSQAAGKTDFDFFTEEHARQAYHDEKKIIASGKPLVGMEEKETWPGGRETWVSTTKVPMRNRENQIIGTFGNSRDITERKTMEFSIRHANEELEKANASLRMEIAERRHVEQALDRERNLLQELINNLPDYIFAKDSEGRFTLGNIALARHMGASRPEELYGKTDFDFYPPDLASQFLADEKALLQSGQKVVEHEETTRDPAGRPMLTLTTKVFLLDNQGKYIGLVGNSRDITERKAMEISIQQANEKLAGMINWLEGRNREINVLNLMAEMLETCRTPEEAYPVISSQMDKLLPVDTGELFLLNKESGLFSVAASWGKDSVGTESFSPQDCRCVQSGNLYFVNIPTPGLYCPHVRLGAGEEPTSLCIPLKDQGEIFGVLHLRILRVKGSPDIQLDLKEELITTAADHIALALANLSLRESLRIQSIRDSLTGLFNRRYLEESVQRELARAKRRGTVLGVIMLDVDNLKGVNDGYGHEAGDTLLAVVGHWLQSNIRAEDISCRYGGDEFVLILPDASLEATCQRARQICEGVRSLEIRHHDRLLEPATVSVGVAGFPENGKTRDALLSAVDVALYKAKEQGRNCVVAAEEKTASE